MNLEERAEVGVGGRRSRLERRWEARPTRSQRRGEEVGRDGRGTARSRRRLVSQSMVSMVEVVVLVMTMLEARGELMASLPAPGLL